jgi:hypothetical protein
MVGDAAQIATAQLAVHERVQLFADRVQSAEIIEPQCEA